MHHICMVYTRIISIEKLLRQKSILLLGPRQSTICRLSSENDLVQYFSLADTKLFRELSANPEILKERLLSKTNLLIVDEAQKLPEIFDEIQNILDRSKNIRVLLTGSSARKLRKSGTNLMPGRIWKKNLHPLISYEIGKPDVLERVKKGSLPGIYTSDNYKEELRQYAGLYLEEEIRAEGFVRNIGSFSRFLEIAAAYNSEQINYTNIAGDLGAAPNTIRSYFQILYDTLIAYELPPFKKTVRRKAVDTPKFYFFDVGVVNGILDRFDIAPKHEIFGKSLESLIFHEINTFIDYNSLNQKLTFWRSQSKHEVDFIIGDSVAIEVKAKNLVNDRDFNGLKALSEEINLKRKIIISLDSHYRKSEQSIEIYPAEQFLRELWEGSII